MDNRQKIKQVVYPISHAWRGSEATRAQISRAGSCEFPMDGAAWSPMYHKTSLLQPAATDRVKSARPHQQKVISV